MRCRYVDEARMHDNRVNFNDRVAVPRGENGIDDFMLSLCSHNSSLN